MKIESAVLNRIRMPLKHPFETSFGRTAEKDFILLSVYGEGLTGYAESVALAEPIYNEETTDTVWYMLEQFLIPHLFSAAISHPDELQSLFKPIRRHYMAKAVLEGAVWDLYAKQLNQPLARVLGGTREEIEVGVSIGIEPSIKALLEKVELFSHEGYKKIKIKIKPGWDVEPIKAIRQSFGDELPLMADANSAYTLHDTDLLKKLDSYNLMMIEQPLAHDDIIDHAQLQAVLKTPICLDESIHTLEDARKAIELGSCKIINIKIGRVGGLTAAKQIHDLCQQKDIPVWCGGMLEAGIGRAHNIALTSLANFTIPGDTSASNRYWYEDIVEPQVELSKPGVLTVPDEPGIGYKLNDVVLQRYLIQSKSYLS